MAMEKICIECFKKQILLIHTVQFLDKLNKILQNARYIHPGADTKFGLEEQNPVKNIFTAKENRHENFYIYIYSSC
jgi:hypothetical protein